MPAGQYVVSLDPDVVGTDPISTIVRVDPGTTCKAQLAPATALVPVTASVRSDDDFLGWMAWSVERAAGGTVAQGMLPASDRLSVWLPPGDFAITFKVHGHDRQRLPFSVAETREFDSVPIALDLEAPPRGK